MKLAFSEFNPPGDTQQNLPPVILMHGMMASRATWNFLGPKIAEQTGRKVYSLDARNHGDSDWSQDFNFDILTDDLVEFMDDHHIRRAILLGHSMGGKTAITLALRSPERVEKLIVEDMSTRSLKSGDVNPVSMLLMLLRQSLSSIPENSDEITAKTNVAKFMAQLMPKDMAMMKAEKIEDLDMIPIKKVGSSYAWQANLDVIEVALKENKLLQQLSGVYLGDSLFLYGTKSFFNIVDDKSIPKYFPYAQVVPVEDSGHLIHMQYPKQFLQEVIPFIDSHSRCHESLSSKY